MSAPDAVRRTRRSNVRDVLGVAAVLVGIWTFLWGELSVANVVSGTAVASALLVAFPVAHDIVAVRHRLRPVAAVRLIIFFVADVLRSTLSTALEVLRPRSQISTGIVACPLRVQNEGLVTFLANLIALSPGTMPVDVSYDPHIIYVHSLHADRAADVRSFISRLEELSVMALGGHEAVSAVAEPGPVEPRGEQA